MIKDLYYNITNWFYRKFRNPYKIYVDGWCPRQAWGRIKNTDYYYYFRARGSQWSLEISTVDIDDEMQEFCFFEKKVWEKRVKNFREWPECGYLEEKLCILLVTQAIDEFVIMAQKV